MPPRDQVGSVRPLDGNADGISACDIGAIERSNMIRIDDIIFADGFED